MGTKKHLLEQGLSSEVFLLAYYVPDTITGIARQYEQFRNEFKKTSEHVAYPKLPQKSTRPATAKILLAVKELTANGYLTQKDGKYYPVTERLMEDIVSQLTLLGIELDSSEKTFLNRLLRQNYYFTFSSMDIIFEIKNQPQRIHRINAIDVFCNKIGMLCTIALFSKKSEKESAARKKPEKTIEKINEELEKSTNKITQDILRKYKKSTRKDKQRTMNLVMSTMKSFVVSVIILERLPYSTAKKFAPLWDQTHGFMIGSMIGEFSNLTPDLILKRIEQINR